MFGIFRRAQRDAIADTPFSEEWKAIIARNFAWAKYLGADDMQELRGLIQIFLAQKTFRGADGFVITDEVRVTVAAQACMLLLNRDHEDYPNLDTVVIHQTTYASPHKRHGVDGLQSEGPRVLGESWDQGVVSLAWDSVIRGGRNSEDGRNVVIHEFAHQLDQEWGPADGAPELEHGSYATWARVLGAEFSELGALLERGKKTLIDPYGATNPAEFFAVVTEAFFEKPRQLRAKHPDLYGELRSFYRQDPAELLSIWAQRTHAAQSEAAP